MRTITNGEVANGVLRNRPWRHASQNTSIMKRLAALVAFGGFLASGVIGLDAGRPAQNRPDMGRVQPFVGHWLGNDRLNEPALLKGMWSPGSSLRIAIKGDLLLVSRGESGRETPYRLDGSTLDAPQGQRTRLTKLTWSNGAMILEVIPADGERGDKFVLTISNERLSMVAESALPSGRVIGATLYFDRARRERAVSR